MERKTITGRQTSPSTTSGKGWFKSHACLDHACIALLLTHALIKFIHIHEFIDNFPT